MHENIPFLSSLQNPTKSPNTMCQICLLLSYLPSLSSPSSSYWSSIAIPLSKAASLVSQTFQGAPRISTKHVHLCSLAAFSSNLGTQVGDLQRRVIFSGYLSSSVLQIYSVFVFVETKSLYWFYSSSGLFSEHSSLMSSLLDYSSWYAGESICFCSIFLVLILISVILVALYFQHTESESVACCKWILSSNEKLAIDFIVSCKSATRSDP